MKDGRSDHTSASDRRSLASPYLRNLRDRIGSELLLMPSAAAIVFNTEREVLLIWHSEGIWGLPGGSIDPLEQPADAAVRETWEETGLIVEPTRIVGVYGGPSHHVTYLNRDEVSYVSIVFECHAIGGALKADGLEVLHAGFFSQNQVQGLELGRIAQTVLPHAFSENSTTRFQIPTWKPPHVPQ